ncbi:O-antigen polymerase [Paenisporosarcina quisquiliarum]|uniref:O-antigen polymerase n=1 Tax=Paenisporosarcina quisquiliarum TaxID=365346 RepID=UPI00373698E0
MKTSIINKNLSFLLLFLVFFLIMIILAVLYSITNDVKYIAFFICSFGSFAYLYEYIRTDFDCFNSDGLFFGVWIFTIGLGQLKLTYTQSTWNYEMWLIVITSLFSFAFGSKIIGLFSKTVELVIISPTDRMQAIKKNVSHKKMKVVLIISYIISFCAYFTEVLHAGTIPLFGDNIGDYANFGISYVHYLVISIGAILVLTYLYFVVYSKDGLLKIMFVMGFVMLISILNRHVIIFSVIGILMVRNYFVKKIKLKNILLLIFLSLIAFTILGSLRNVSSDYLVAAIGYKEKYNLVFMWTYHYLTVGFTNLQNAIELHPSLTYGLQTFTPFWTFTGLKALFSQSVNPYFSGVGTFLEGYYLDFGVIGIIIFPFLLGFFSKFIYLKITTTRIGIISFTIYFTVVNQLVFLFFTDYFSYTHIPLQVIVAAIIYVFSKRKVKLVSSDRQI